MTGKLNLIAVGGCGTNVVASIYPRLKELGEGFSDVTCSFIDSTEKTIQAYPEYEDRFFKITSSSASSKGLDGTGGERKSKENIAHMNKSVREFLDNGVSKNLNDYYVIVSSGSGGTGSSAGVLLLKAMLEQDYTVITVTVGDSSSYLALNNTINTITSIQGVALKSKKAVSNIYYSNTIGGVTSPKTEAEVNEKIFKMLSVISMFISGSIQNIDHQDMINFFRPDKYQSFRTAPGIYSLGVAVGELVDESVILVRTIISEDTKDINMTITPQQSKTGTITTNYDRFGTYPLFLTQRRGVLNAEVAYLKEELERIEAIKNAKYDSFDALDDAELDEFGMAL